MKSLDDTWQWYEDTKRQLQRMLRLAKKYWSKLEGLDADSLFRNVSPESIVDAADHGLDELEDLAVVVLFSAFEAKVRDIVHADMISGAPQSDNPAVQKALEDARLWVREGSFYRILEAYKIQIDKNLIEEVNQVRKYRNWVAHGRRSEQPICKVIPRSAYERLKKFLTSLQPDDKLTD
jgi:hypothetical protein